MSTNVRYLSAIFNPAAHKVVNQVIEILRNDHAARIAPRLIDGKPMVFHGDHPQCRDRLGTTLAYAWMENYEAVHSDRLGKDVKELLEAAWSSLSQASPEPYNILTLNPR